MAKVVKPAGQKASAQRPKMHGSVAERRLMGGTGALIKWSAAKVPVTGDKPRSGRP